MSLVETSWTRGPIAILDVRRLPGTVCSIQFLDPSGALRCASGRTARWRHGGSIDLFHSGVLAQTLGCSVQAIYGWEQRYGFPRPRWNVRRSRGMPLTSRWYSRRQLFAIGMLHRHFGFLCGRFRERVADFSAAVSGLFDDVDRVPAAELKDLIGAALLLGRPEIADRLRPAALLTAPIARSPLVVARDGGPHVGKECPHKM